MKELKIKYVDFWDGFDYENHMIFVILRKYYKIVLSENPDYLIYSVFGDEHLKYDCIKIFWTGENIVPDFNLCDYAIGFEYMEYGDRYIRVPNYFSAYYDTIRRCMEEKHTYECRPENKKFCSFVYSNGNADEMRDKIFYALSGYKQVDSGGHHLNNICSGGGGVTDKLDFEKGYKFSIACENASRSGYSTEKIVGAFAAGTIPVYWGDPDIKRIFNEKAFFCVSDYERLDQLVTAIANVDRDDQLYMNMLREPALKDPDYVQKTFQNLEVFLLHIFNMPLENCMRRGNVFWQKKYLEDMRRAKRARDYPVRTAVSIEKDKLVFLIKRIRRIVRRMEWRNKKNEHDKGQQYR